MCQGLSEIQDPTPLKNIRQILSLTPVCGHSVNATWAHTRSVRELHRSNIRCETSSIESVVATDNQTKGSLQSLSLWVLPRKKQRASCLRATWEVLAQPQSMNPAGNVFPKDLQPGFWSPGTIFPWCCNLTHWFIHVLFMRGYSLGVALIPSNLTPEYQSSKAISIYRDGLADRIFNFLTLAVRLQKSAFRS